MKGDIVVFFGNVHLDGQAHQDVVNFFGSVTAADNSAIGGDLVSFFGSIRLGENVRVNQDMVAMFGTVHNSASVSIGQDHVVFSPWILFGPLLIIFLIVFVIVHEVRAHRERRFMQAYPATPPPPVSDSHPRMPFSALGLWHGQLSHVDGSPLAHRPARRQRPGGPHVGALLAGAWPSRHRPHARSLLRALANCVYWDGHRARPMG